MVLQVAMAMPLAFHVQLLYRASARQAGMFLRITNGLCLNNTFAQAETVQLIFLMMLQHMAGWEQLMKALNLKKQELPIGQFQIPVPEHAIPPAFMLFPAALVLPVHSLLPALMDTGGRLQNTPAVKPGSDLWKIQGRLCTVAFIKRHTA